MALKLNMQKDRIISTMSAISPSLADILSPTNEEEMETLSKLDLGMLFQW